jgi:hypothetical protein
MTDTQYRGRQAELDYRAERSIDTSVKGVWDSKDRRQFRRHPLAANSILVANGNRYPCVIEDIAIGGLRVSVDAVLPIHTLVKFEDEDAGTLKGKVLRATPGSAVIRISADKGSAAYILDLICGMRT